MPHQAQSFHPKKRVLRALGFRDPNLHARKSEFQWGTHLGSGTYGEVTQCTWLTKKPSQEVAIKVVSKASVPNPSQQTSLLNRSLKLNHPHVIQNYDWFQSKEHVYIILELAEGGELFDHAISHGPFTDRDTCVMMRDVLDAVAYIHRQGIVHRDLKPENLFVRGKAPFEPPYDLVVADFGVAVYINRPDGSTTNLNGICGSPGYTAPEVYRKESYGKSVDIWAIGVITFVLLSGRFPFAHLSGPEFLADCEDEIKFPKRFGISQPAQNFITGCLQIDPSKRWTAEEALEHPWFDQLNTDGEDAVESQTAASLADTDHTRCDLPHLVKPETEDKAVEMLATASSSSEQIPSDKPELLLTRSPTIQDESVHDIVT